MLHSHPESLVQELAEKALQIRLDVLDMVYRRQAGHPGGSFSAAEILACLYFHHLRIDPARPLWEGRRRHLCPNRPGHGIAHGCLRPLGRRHRGGGETRPEAQAAVCGRLGGIAAGKDMGAGSEGADGAPWRK
jgi:Transketolase, thiamine diphosphate binding domain